jgi:hypothetical protein
LPFGGINSQDLDTLRPQQSSTIAISNPYENSDKQVEEITKAVNTGMSALFSAFRKKG